MFKTFVDKISGYLNSKKSKSSADAAFTQTGPSSAQNSPSQTDQIRFPFSLDRDNFKTIETNFNQLEQQLEDTNQHCLDLEKQLQQNKLESQLAREENRRLREENQQLRQQNTTQKKELEKLQLANNKLEANQEQDQAKIKELKERIEALTRSAHRQACPFGQNESSHESSQEKQNTNSDETANEKDQTTEKKEGKKKRPGQRKGHRAYHGRIPDESEIDRTINVPAPTNCPKCRVELINNSYDDQYVEDIPPPRKPYITRFRIQHACCPNCRKSFKNRHPEMTSTAMGGAKVQNGPNALCLAAEMKHRLGVNYEKIADIFETYHHLKINASTLVRAGQRLAKKAEPTYKKLIKTIQGSEVVHKASQ